MKRKKWFPVLLTVLLLLVVLPYLFAQGFRPPHCHHASNELRCVKYVSNQGPRRMRFQVQAVHPLLGKNVWVHLDGLYTPSFKAKKKCEKEKAKLAAEALDQRLKKASIIHLTGVQRNTSPVLRADVLADGQSMRKLLIKKRLAFPRRKGDSAPAWCEDPKQLANLQTPSSQSSP